jgi:hypothetical protein
VFKRGYEGLQTLPEAWTTHYCDLQSGACQGVHQLDTVLVTAENVAKKAGLSLCKSSAAGAICVGIEASPPMMVGNREKFGKNWGLGLCEASGLCYQVTGPGGPALLAITDRCGGFCNVRRSATTTSANAGNARKPPISRRCASAAGQTTAPRNNVIDARPTTTLTTTRSITCAASKRSKAAAN